MGQGHAASRMQSPPGIAVRVEGRQGQCRICHEYGGDLIKPCLCDGTSKWVHRDCLNRWRASRTNPRSLTNCCECGFQYFLDLHRIIQDEGEARRRRFVRRVAAQGAMSFGLVQVAIIVLGFIIRLIDQDEELVHFFNFPQNAGGLDRADFHNALLQHKTTYYVSGAIAFFALLGLGGIVLGIVYTCTAGLGSVDARAGTCNCDAYDMYFCADCCHSCSYSCARCCVAPTSRGVRGGDCNCNDCCHDCDCSQCNPQSRAGDKNAMSVLVAVAIVILIVLVLVGVLIAIVMLVIAIQRTLQQYTKLQQVRVLAEEYIVRDLADSSDLGDASGGDGNTVQQQRMETGLPSASQQAFMAPDPEFQAKMHQLISKDISAIFEGPDPRQALRDEPLLPTGTQPSVIR